MASVYDLKPRFQGILRPMVGGLVAAGITPNQVTVAAAAGSIAVGAAVTQAGRLRALLLLLPLWLLARMALNAIDGMMAREHGLATRTGAVLNELGDVISDLALYLPLATLAPEALWPVVAFSIGAALTEFSGLLGLAIGATRRYEGPMGKSDRALLVGLVGLATFFLPRVASVWSWIFGLGFGLSVITCWNRIHRALGQSDATGATR